MDTIFALATAQGKAGVSIIRISGPDAEIALNALASLTVPIGRPSVRSLIGKDGTHIDEAMVLRFAKPHSFTGEDVVELHVHGSIAVVQAVLRAGVSVSSEEAFVSPFRLSFRIFSAITSAKLFLLFFSVS